MTRLSIMLAGLLALLAVDVASATTLRDLEGHAATIEQYAGKGRWLVVMIWASDCHVCNQEASHYGEFHQQHSDLDAHVIGLSMDGEKGLADARQFVKRHQLPFPNLIGEPLEVAVMFTRMTGVPWSGTPTFLIYNPEGQLEVQQAGAVPVNLIEDYIAQNAR